MLDHFVEGVPSLLADILNEQRNTTKAVADLAEAVAGLAAVLNRTPAPIPQEVAAVAEKAEKATKSAKQQAANAALRAGLIDYDRRHGWRGARSKVDLPAEETPAALEELLDEAVATGSLIPAVVLKVEQRSARVYVRGSGIAEIGWEGLSWARRKQGKSLGPAPKSAGEILARGDLIHVTSELAEVKPGNNGAQAPAQRRRSPKPAPCPLSPTSMAAMAPSTTPGSRSKTGASSLPTACTRSYRS